MPVNKGNLQRDTFVDYGFEDVMVRYEASSGRFFRKFYGDDEYEVEASSGLLNDALASGDEIDAETYEAGRAAQAPISAVALPVARRVDHGALSDEIVAALIEGKQPQENPRVVFYGGAPGTGDDFIAETLFDFVRVDPAEIRAQIAKRAPGEAANAGLVREIAGRLAVEAGERRLNLYVVGSAEDTLPNLTRKVEAYRANGSRVIGHFVTCDPEVAVRRAQAAGRRTGRYVPATLVREIQSTLAKTLPGAIRRGLFDVITVWDATPILMARGSEVKDKAAWARFLKRAK